MHVYAHFYVRVIIYNLVISRWNVEETRGNVVLVTNVILIDHEANHFTEYSSARLGQGSPGK